MNAFSGYLRGFACTFCIGGLVFGMGCASCTTKPVTTEKDPPDLVLNVIDLSNSSGTVRNVPPLIYKDRNSYTGVTPDPQSAPYNILFEILATDSGGIQSISYSSVFNSGDPCSTGSDFMTGSNVEVPTQTLPKNPDGTVPSVWPGFVSVTSQQEDKIICGSKYTLVIPGTYVVKAAATNYSNKKKEATWYVNIGSNGVVLPPSP
jgi:hypothetical protein